MTRDIIKQITDGRTDLVLDIVRTGLPATTADEAGTPLVKWCAYYGDVSAIRFLLANGESLQSLGDNLDLHGAAFHGHWRLCQFLIAQGADVNKPLAETGESPLHAALCTTEKRLFHSTRKTHDRGLLARCATRLTTTKVEEQHEVCESGTHTMRPPLVWLLSPNDGRPHTGRRDAVVAR